MIKRRAKVAEGGGRKRRRAVATRIINDVKGVNRVVYDATSNLPGTIEFGLSSKLPWRRRPDPKWLSITSYGKL